MSKPIIHLLSCAWLVTALSVPAEALSNASHVSRFGSAMVLGGSVMVLAGSAELLVKSVQHSGELTVVVLESAATGASVTLQLSGEVAGGMALASGRSVQLVSEPGGHLLVASGTVLAFIPNELGQGLLHHSKAS